MNQINKKLFFAIKRKPTSNDFRLCVTVTSDACIGYFGIRDIGPFLKGYWDICVFYFGIWDIQEFWDMGYWNLFWDTS